MIRRSNRGILQFKASPRKKTFPMIGRRLPVRHSLGEGGSLHPDLFPMLGRKTAATGNFFIPPLPSYFFLFHFIPS
jgi:hypothetical protein